MATAILERAATRAASGGVDELCALVEAWPGPALLLAADGATLAASANAAPLIASLDAVPGGRATVFESAVQFGKSRVAQVPAGQGVSLEIALVPVAGCVALLGRDVTANAAMRAALTDSRQRYKALVELSSDFAWEADGAGRFTFVSPKGALGYRAEDLLGRRAAELIAESDVRDGRSPFETRERLDEVDLWLVRADGESACVSLAAVPIVDGSGRQTGVRGLWRDVTSERARDEELAAARNRERLLAYVTRTIRDEVEPAAMLAAAAAAAGRALGAAGCAIWRGASGTPAELAASFGVVPAQGDPATVGDGPHALLRDTHFQGERNGAIGLWRAADAPEWNEDERALLGDLAAQIGIALAQAANQALLERLAETDALTGLMNRRSFTRGLGERIVRAVRDGAAGALVYIDLDNFKPVNDRLGHAAGDAALKAVAAELRAVVRPYDLVARLGGDEFALWLDRIDPGSAMRRAEQVHARAIALAPFSADEARKLGFSIGVAVFEPASGETMEALLARADESMYAAKRGGKGRCCLAPPAPRGET